MGVINVIEGKKWLSDRKEVSPWVMSLTWVPHRLMCKREVKIYLYLLTLPKCSNLSLPTKTPTWSCCLFLIILLYIFYYFQLSHTYKICGGESNLFNLTFYSYLNHIYLLPIIYLLCVSVGCHCFDQF